MKNARRRRLPFGAAPVSSRAPVPGALKGADLPGRDGRPAAAHYVRFRDTCSLGYPVAVNDFSRLPFWH
ncbi:hypothetical protein [Geomesophilobacter sediminis]|uniref:Uncharacterized protein n=1 Tax=Geomesophilobacter sediminis TaxID=2798584 RepID=A0A8J7IPX7_9BACT|nr:hypothetical protein [Geomesophilobacter sediminis]MBJ6724549.1 hypothetical protein [Geomesophilobacter sediminis]